MATVVTKIVDTGGGEGADYTSLAAWEAAEQCNLVTQNQIAKVYCRATTGVADSTPVTLAGWTTDENHYVWITTEPEYRHQGVWNSSIYRMQNLSMNNESLIRAEIPNYRIEWMQFYGVAQEGSSGKAVLHACDSSTCDVYIRNNIFRSQSTYGGTARNFGIDIQLSSSDGYFSIQNNLLFNFKGHIEYSSAIRYNASVGRAWVDHNTVYNANFGYWCGAAKRIHAQFNIATKCRNGYKGTFGDNSKKNVSDIAGDAPGENPISGEPKFINTSSGDFDLHRNDTVARNQAASFVVSNDLKGRTRPAMTYSDCGCFEHTSLDIVIADASHGHTADNVGYTQTHIIAAHDVAHEHTADGPLSFTQEHNIVIQDADHGHTADNCDVNISTQIEIQNAFHEHTVDGDLVIPWFTNIVAAKCNHSHTVDGAVRFTQEHNIEVQDSDHGHTADKCDANVRVNIVIADVSHGHTVDGDLVFTQEHNIEIDNTTHEFTSDHVQLNPTGKKVAVVSAPVRVVVCVDVRSVTNSTPERVLTANREGE